MTIKLNNEIIKISEDSITISELILSKNIKSNGTAIAVNGKLIPRNSWNNHHIFEGDDIILISAAFGG